MKILYGIQGTGNGHLSRGKFIYDLLTRYADCVDVLISGSNYSLTPSMPVKYRNKGVTFSIKNGKIDYLKTLSNFDLFTSYMEQKKIPFKDYDLIVTDFEPITAWASVRHSIPSIHISHQASFIDSNVPRPAFKNLIGEYVMKYFCPTNDYIGLHYRNYGDNISEPIILDEIKNVSSIEKDHISIYLPWYDDDFLVNVFKNFKDLKFHIFSKKTNKYNSVDNIFFQPINNVSFVQSLASSYGVICNAGFQTTSEALYLGKRLLAIPVKGQYEQACNAEALKQLGVSCLKDLKIDSKQDIIGWLESSPIQIKFQNTLEELFCEKIKSLIKDF